MAISTAAPPGIDTQQHTVGDMRISVTRVTLDASYPTGGYTVTPANLGLGRVLFADTALTDENAASAIVPWYEPSTSALKMYGTTGEIAAATNVATLVVQIIAYGY